MKFNKTRRWKKVMPNQMIRWWLPKQITSESLLVIGKLFVTVTYITYISLCVVASCPKMSLPKNNSKGIHANYYYGVWWLLHLTNMNTIYYIRLLFRHRCSTDWLIYSIGSIYSKWLEICGTAYIVWIIASNRN